MKEFMMLFRSEPKMWSELSPEQMQSNMKKWQDWIGGIAAQGKFVSTSRLGFNGKTVKPDNTVTDGPYAELKEIVGGNMVVKAENIDEVVEMAKGCPSLEIGGHVEVRDTMEVTL
ncbi:YciI family protein [Flammeovirgaceae bacterium SG7u.111]|nr:YciI family protein [Flammeovirgaceae bacterium SG7u.132]WPO37307.1 YciI family protein [Flammeovirgaceae bacterium SG7u.111]